MKPMRFPFVIAAVLLAAACSKESPRTEAASDIDRGDVAEAQPAAPATAPAAAAPGGANGPVIDGPLANQPNARMPAAGASANAAPPLGPPPADADSVRLALLDGMGEMGSNLRVQVTPRGVVTLSGEVATVPDRQRAHYLARAVPGVAEVDLRGVRVRQP